MLESIHSELEPVLTRWTMGGHAADIAPAAWKDRLGADQETRELSLVALTGLCLGATLVPEPVGELTAIADVPVLPLPVMPQALRASARRVVSEARNPRLRTAALAFMAARGHVMHPADWMPGAGDAAPPIYAPWQDWSQRRAAPTTAGSDMWDEFGPAERRRRLSELRSSDPEAARTMIEERIAGESPDVRLGLVEVMSTGLSPEDRPFLESLARDRAPRVQAAARSLLARLGHSVASDEDILELAGFFRTETRGMIRRTTHVVAVQPRNTAQAARRNDLMAGTDLVSFSRSMGLPDADLVALWNWGADPTLDGLFADIVARSGSEAAVQSFAAAVRAGARMPFGVTAALASRLSEQTRRELAERDLAQGVGIVSLAETACPDPMMSGLRRHHAWRALLSDMHDSVARPTAHSDELLAFGILATPDEAREMISALAQIGVPTADPRLDMLRLNAAL